MTMDRWEIDSGHSGIHFSIRHMALARVRGQFTRWSGTLAAEDGDLRGACVSILIDASSVHTGLEERDAHLRSADFLDVEAFPEILFQGRVCAPPRGHRFRIRGELAVLGRVHPMIFEVCNTGRVIDPWGHERAGFSCAGTLDRSAFGITWNRPLGALGHLVANEVEFEMDVEAVLQEPGAPRGDRPPASGRLPHRPGLIDRGLLSF